MAFQIVVQPSGRSFTVDGDETLLSAGIRQGLNMPYGCKDGACGSCKCKKISGEVQLGTYQTKALMGAKPVPEARSTMGASLSSRK